MQPKCYVIPDDADDMSEAIENIAIKIKAEIDSFEIYTKNYHSHIGKDICSQFQSSTHDLMSRVSQKFMTIFT